MTLDRNLLDAEVDRNQDALQKLALAMHAEPELKFEEHRAVQWMAEVLEQRGFQVERNLGGLPTAFRAKVGTGPVRVAVLAEYDALPEVGHACGHNLIAGGALGAFLSFAGAPQAELGGSVELIGTPGEEGGAGKVKLLDAGVFKGLDAAVMFHPYDQDIIAHPTLANVWLKVAFTGVPSHGAAAPHKGKSALTACMDSFRLVDGQRIHFRDGVRVHGIITNGGQASNIIPEHAACEYLVRARTSAELERVTGIVRRCIQAAAMASDVEVKMESVPGYKEMWTSGVLAQSMDSALRALGRTPVMTDETAGMASTDMGDVSQAVPALHAWIAICERGEAQIHEHRFAERTRGERGLNTMLLAAKAMARTLADYLEDGNARAEAAQELQQRRSG